jgi:3-dehydrotetronate 4-kinase
VPVADAVVVGLRIRTAPVAEAVERASNAADWLLRAGPAVLAWKICSTFDSTPAGNIGPVTDALLALTGLPAALVCPAFAENGRVVHGGRLYVHGVALDESPMRDHPLTPMRDADLARLLAPQVAEPGRIVRIDAAGDATGAIEAAIAAGARYLIPDAPDDAAAAALGDAVVGRALPVVASGLVPGLVAGLRRAGRLPGAPTEPPAVPRAGGPALIVAGSCSTATRGQVERFATTYPVVRLEPRLADPAAAAIRAARQALFEGAPAVLVASSADPAGVAAVQRELGPRAGARIEHWLGQVATALVEDGVRRLVVAGGETTGAVIDALGVRMFEVGAELAPGVPVLTADNDGGRLLLVAKSGNFGGPDLFAQVLDATRMDEDEVAQAERRGV